MSKCGFFHRTGCFFRITTPDSSVCTWALESPDHHTHSFHPPRFRFLHVKLFLFCPFIGSAFFFPSKLTHRTTACFVGPPLNAAGVPSSFFIAPPPLRTIYFRTAGPSFLISRKEIGVSSFLRRSFFPVDGSSTPIRPPPLNLFKLSRSSPPSKNKGTWIPGGYKSRQPT